jgi:nitric oxide reductase large subunit
LLALQRLYSLSLDRRLTWFVWIWNIGLVLTAGGLTTKGTLQVIASPIVESPALAGVSGMGHIMVSVGFLLVFLILKRGIRGPPR